jgi:hypothetical protein
MGKVYLVGCPEEDRYKIGYTNRDIYKRLDEIQTGNPKKIEVVHLFETDHHVKVEGWMHRKYGSKRMEGEWFELNEEDVENFLINCQEGHDIFQMLIDSGNPFV